ncbi:hypothetical protein [Roseibium aestuarii]|uniref:Uncharacterized protein n=1 Tax=Roseibium aestuarii TaxID=2600299 RepID=A0ABW4JPZ0_9HYPH|nr:hypothetical protein [Roseibium aestuarii]
MTPSLAGLIGAGLGLYLGWLDGKVLSGILGAQAERKRGEGAGNSILVRYQAQIRALSLGCPLVAFPIIGYWAGISLAG